MYRLDTKNILVEYSSLCSPSHMFTAPENGYEKAEWDQLKSVFVESGISFNTSFFWVHFQIINNTTVTYFDMFVQSVKIILSYLPIFILNNISSKPLHCYSEVVTHLALKLKHKMSTHTLRSYA
jgi:hypothetical protein